MPSKIKERLKEPSTYAGLAAIIAGVGQIVDIKEAPAVAEALTNAAPAIISGNWLGAAMVAFGALAIVLKEKGNGKFNS